MYINAFGWVVSECENLSKSYEIYTASSETIDDLYSVYIVWYIMCFWKQWNKTEARKMREKYQNG